MTISDEPDDTMPAPHPDTPEWAVHFYNMMLKVHQESVQERRERDAFILEFTAIAHDHEGRLRGIESRYARMNGATPVEDPPTNPGG